MRVKKTGERIYLRLRLTYIKKNIYLVGEAARTQSCWLLFVWCVFFIWTLTQFYGCALNSNQVAERIKRSHSQHSLIYASRRERKSERDALKEALVHIICILYDFFIVFYIILFLATSHTCVVAAAAAREDLYIFFVIYSLSCRHTNIYIVIYRALCFVLSNPRSGVPGNCLAGKGEALVGAAGRMRQRQTPCKHSVLMVGLTWELAERLNSFFCVKVTAHKRWRN